jgi:hypothetical protein
VHPLLYPFLAAACSFSIFGVGLLYVGWLFRRDEPDRWRLMSSHRARNAAILLVAIAGPPAFFGLAGRVNPIVLMCFYVPPILASAVMGAFWGRLDHGKAKGRPVDPEL